MDISNLISDRVVTAVGGHLGLMGLIKPDTESIELIGIKGFTEDAIMHYRQMAVMERLPLMHTIRTGEPVWIETHEEYISQYPHIDTFLGETGTQAAASLPLSIHGQIIGAIKIFFPKERHFSDEEKLFLQTVAQQFAQALERARLYEAQREEAVFEERQRLARDLHDDISQSLASINMLGQSLPRLLKKDPERAQEILSDILAQTQATNSQMRTLLFELRPANIVKNSLTNLFHQLINAIQGRRKVVISCIVEIESPLPEVVHLTLYRIVQETLNNMVKHSEATEGSISLTHENGHLVLRIRDNGRGFNTDQLSAGFGLEGMRERAALIGASFEIVSTEKQGTEIVISKLLP